ncbi:MAG: hypothetical protein LR001_07255 [Clostridiales bacterium]|nr:hypothetical protein [Clostridiales bacterium]
MQNNVSNAIVIVSIKKEKEESSDVRCELKNLEGNIVARLVGLEELPKEIMRLIENDKITLKGGAH